ncbi:DUF948 domain-containing protein [Paenibacillus arenilitoris]|uniref:DUF948 domain-containing protein n=1 Tax=Paenibacillus arenilitoris TaxID=2772299 RepID=A0A927CG84_9BACL|nr:DUF948 domain-containing protein [Paenibacillus arenilitoris]MBD2867524.1 DUF948 domain-containing protein [Paenibacillus arenilitoris]
MEVIAWSAAVAAGAFVLLAIGMLIALRSALGRLARAQASAEAMQRDVHKLAQELSGLAAPAEATIREAHKHLQSAGRLFEAAGQVGAAIAHTTSAVERVSSVLSESAERHANRAATKRQVEEALEWAELGMAAWQLWQTSRKAAAPAGTVHDPKPERKPESSGRDEGHAKNEGSDDNVNT